MDLTALLAVEAATEDLLRRALAHLAADQPSAAEAELLAAKRLRQDPLIDALLGYVHWGHPASPAAGNP
jgi:hypothetical protein